MDKKGYLFNLDCLDIWFIIFISVLLFLWIVGFLMFTVYTEIRMKENTPIMMHKDCDELILESTNCPLHIYLEDFFYNLGTHYFGCWDENDQEKILRAKGCFEYGVEIKDG